ncbi:MAG: UvrD-helicase domain-containing protein [Polyangiaceae bacterium]
MTFGAKAPLLTEVDEIVLSFQRNVVVAASAGTGKTHRLTALYVLIALGLTSMGKRSRNEAAAPVAPDRIWATTFTRAAAGEIAERVEKALGELARDPAAERAPFANEIRARAAMLHDPPSVATLKKRAAEALARWPAARIDTLHGLAGRVVDRHGLTLGLPPGMRILDEDESAYLGALAIDEVLSRALSTNQETASAARALLSAAGGIGPLRTQLLRLFDRLDEEGVEPRSLALSDHVTGARETMERILAIARGISVDGMKAFQAPARALLDACAPRLGHHATEPRGRENEGPQRPPPHGGPPVHEVLPRVALEPLLDLLSLPMRGKKKPADEELDELRKNLGNGTLRQNAERLAAFLRHAHDLSARERGVVHVLEDARRAARARRRRAGALGFGDILRAARDGLRDRPDLAEMVHADVDVLLVDEFQDTSTVQRDLVYLLRERDDARRARRAGDVPPPNDLARHGLFLVGDRKQSIYGFRGADVAVFSRVCAELGGDPAAHALRLPKSASPRAPHADFVALAVSRRSGAAVLGFVNAFSACDFSEGRAAHEHARDFEIEYSPAEHLIPLAEEAEHPIPLAEEEEILVDGPSALEEPPATRTEPPRAPEGSPAELDVVEIVDEDTGPSSGVISRAPGGRGRGDVIEIVDDGAVPEQADALTREAEGPLREALVAAAWIAVDRARTGRPAKDYAVLARRRNTLPLVSVALERLGVPFVVAGRALYDAPEVRDVAALVRLVVEPRDRLALATVLRGPVVALSDTALAALSEPGRGLASVTTGALPERASLLMPEELRRLNSFRDAFAALRRAALRAPPGEALRALVTGFDLDRVLAALPRAEARLANVDRLIAIAAERGGSLAAFARWLDRRIADESDEPEGVVFAEDDDAVRLLTIHGSKGLDFPVVVLVDLAAEPRPTYPGVDLVPPQGERPASLLVRHFSPLYTAEEDEFAPLLLLPTRAMKEAQAESRAREQAERRRLTYVALTRAEDTLVLVSPAAPPRGSSAWKTLAVALPPEGRAKVTRNERAAELLEAATRIGASAGEQGSPAGAAHEGRAAGDGRPPESRTTDPPRSATLHPRQKNEAESRAESPGNEGRIVIAAPQTIALPTTSLSMFDGCARRYRLRYLLGFDEPLASAQLDLFSLAEAEEAAEAAPAFEDEDARDVGRAAHRVLERWPASRWGDAPPPEEIEDRLVSEGVSRASPELPKLAQGLAAWIQSPYVCALRDDGARLYREEPFVLEVRGAAALALRGAMDLVVERGDRVDVIDYKRSRPRADLSGYAFQLRAYALAISRRFPGARVRAGVLFLGAEAEPRWLRNKDGSPEIQANEHAEMERSLAQLAARYARARTDDVWDGVPIERCRALHCGFVTACHRGKEKKK